jgi:hypothetical protein
MHYRGPQAKIRTLYSNYFANPDPSVFGPLAEVQIRVTLSGEYYRWAKASALAYRMIYEQPVIYEYSHLSPPTLLMNPANIEHMQLKLKNTRSPSSMLDP